MPTTPYPPGPYNGSFAFRHIARFFFSPLSFLERLGTYGDLPCFRMLTQRAYLVNHPDLLHQVLSVKRKSFRKLPRVTRALQPAVGNGLIVSEGELWKRQRRMVQPTFHPSYFDRYADETVDATQRMLARWDQQRSIEVGDEMTRLTVEIAARMLFSADLKGEMQEFADAVQHLTHLFSREMRSLVVLPDWAPLPGKFRKRRAVRTLDNLIARIIRERRASGEDPGDLLSMLLSAVDEDGDGRGMSDAQAVDEAKTLFNAAYHATSMALVWTLYLIAKHPDVQAKVKAEVDEALAGRRPTREDAENLPYTAMVIKESLRLYPPAWGLFTREAIEDVELGGYTIRRGSWMLIYPWVTHRDERFFENAKVFDPLRFSEDRIGDIPQHAYFPFGLGPNACIGASLAMLQMTLMIASVVQRRRVSLSDPNSEAIPHPSLALRPKQGLSLRVRRRAAVPAMERVS